MKIIKSFFMLILSFVHIGLCADNTVQNCLNNQQSIQEMNSALRYLLPTSYVFFDLGLTGNELDQLQKLYPNNFKIWFLTKRKVPRFNDRK